MKKLAQNTGESAGSRLEVPAGHAHVVLLLGVIKLGEAPVDEPQLPLRVVDHHIVGLEKKVKGQHGGVRITKNGAATRRGGGVARALTSRCMMPREWQKSSAFSSSYM